MIIDILTRHSKWDSRWLPNAMRETLMHFFTDIKNTKHQETHTKCVQQLTLDLKLKGREHPRLHAGKTVLLWVNELFKVTLSFQRTNKLFQ